MSKIYLAGPIQHVNDYGKGWRERLKQERDEFEWVDPMDKYNSMQDAEAEWTDEDIVEEDLRLIDECSAVLVHWEAVPTAGTPMETFYASRNGIPVVVQTTLQDPDISPWISAHADAIVSTFDDAIYVFDEYLSDQQLSV